MDMSLSLGIHGRIRGCRTKIKNTNAAAPTYKKVSCEEPFPSTNGSQARRDMFDRDTRAPLASRKFRRAYALNAPEA